MKESDWKKFKKIREKALDAFCTRTLDEFSGVISNTEEHAHNRYLQLYTLVHTRNEEMAFLFNGLSRSKAPGQLMGMRSHRLVDESMLEDLSEEFRWQTDPKPFARG